MEEQKQEACRECWSQAAKKREEQNRRVTVQGTEIQDVVTGVSAWYSFRGRSGIDQNCQGLKIMLGDFKV